MAMKTQRMVAIAAGAASVLALVGCAPGTSQNEGEAEDELRIALTSDITTLHPWMTRSIKDLNVLSQVYSALVVRDSSMKLVPGVAESWEQSSPTSWRFTLRDDVTFPNGEALDAAVVKWNIDQILDEATEARVRSSFAGVTEAVVVDDYVVEIVTAEPDTTVPAGLTTFFLLEPKWTETHDPSAETYGTGPYKLASWNKQSSIKLERRADDPWNPEPFFENVEFQIIPEQSSQIASLQTGGVDIITEYGPDQISTLSNIEGLEVGARSTTRSAFLYLDATTEPMNDTRVRQAVNYAIDKEAIVEGLFGGLTEVSAGQIMTPEYVGFNDKLEPYAYDPDKARELLDEAGYGDGLTVTFRYPSGTYLLAEDVVQVIAAQLAEVGIVAEVAAMSGAEYIDMNYARTELPDVGYLTYAWWTLDGADIMENFMGGGAQQFWYNDEFDSILAQALVAVDEAERARLTAEAAAIMRDDAGFVFLFPQPLTYAYDADLNWEPRSDDWIRASDITSG